jgi:hypothetical protein
MVALDSAAVQAWSAVAIVLLTAVLVGATLAYVRQTSDLATQAKRTNDLTLRDMELRPADAGTINRSA